MTLFDHLVDAVFENNPELNLLRPVVEKEILHHEILDLLSREGMLRELTFMGGTCLRICHGSPRLSEDLDFAGQREFSFDELAPLGEKLPRRLHEKYGLAVEVAEPRIEGDTRTWKIKIITRPDSPHLPAQKIHLDICSVPSLRRIPSLPVNHYGVDLGTAGLILQTESKEEILADKYIALALRPNRVKFRDIWDIIWLMQQNVILKADDVHAKRERRGIDKERFLNLLSERGETLSDMHKDFLKEMTRFLPAQVVGDSLSHPDWWIVACRMINERIEMIRKE